MINSSRVRAMVDVDPASTLKAQGSAAVTATTQETAISLNRLSAAYWNSRDPSAGLFSIAVNVSALDLTSGDEVYTFQIVADDVLAMNHLPVNLVTASLRSTGFHVFEVDSKTADLLGLSTINPGAYIAAKMTVAGTTPSITYSAWLYQAEAY
jgi:hypothetical protein